MADLLTTVKIFVILLLKNKMKQQVNFDIANYGIPKSTIHSIGIQNFINFNVDRWHEAWVIIIQFKLIFLPFKINKILYLIIFMESCMLQMCIVLFVKRKIIQTQ